MSVSQSFFRTSIISAAAVAFSAGLSMSPAFAWAKAATPDTAPTAMKTAAASSSGATAASGGACYAKKDGTPSAFDAIDASRSGAITMDQVANFYKAQYGSLSAADKAKTPLEKYVSNHTGYFKGIDKDKNGTISCSEYQASIAKLTTHKTATLKTAPAAAPAA